MMLREPPALHDEGVSALLAHEDDGHALLRPIDVEEHSVPAEEAQLALGHGIRAERLHVPRLN
jgi:hypothetical protein